MCDTLLHTDMLFHVVLFTNTSVTVGLLKQRAHSLSGHWLSVEGMHLTFCSSEPSILVKNLFLINNSTACFLLMRRSSNTRIWWLLGFASQWVLLDCVSPKHPGLEVVDQTDGCSLSALTDEELQSLEVTGFPKSPSALGPTKL